MNIEIKYNLKLTYFITEQEIDKKLNTICLVITRLSDIINLKKSKTTK